MAIEIERKFLVEPDRWQRPAQGFPMKQGYLFVNEKQSVRIRLQDERAILTLKSKAGGIRRLEYEYEIPLSEAHEMLAEMHVGTIISKTRFKLEAGQGLFWEVDEFHGENDGLLLAEIELPDEDHPFDRPDWLGREVTADPRYLNAYLSQHPYRSWK